MRHFFPVLLVLLLGKITGLTATPPAWYQEPSSSFDLQTDQSLGNRINYSGSNQRVVVDPARAASKPPSLTLRLEYGAGIQQFTVVVGPGGRFKSTGGTFKAAVFKCLPGGVIELENCSFMQAYFTTEGPPVPGKSPQVTLKDCTLHYSQIDSPQACGLAARNCRLISSNLDASEEDGRAQSPSFLSCVFSECTLDRAEVFMASSKSFFSMCTCLGGFPESLGDYLDKPVLVQMIWAGSTRQPPPAAGKVHFDFLPYDKAVETIGAARNGLMDTAMLTHNHSLGASLGDPQARTVASRPPMRQEEGVITASAVASGMTFKSRITSVNGLLISQLPSGEEAGQMSKLTLTALPSQGGQPTTLKFNQKVGGDMQKALNEVSKFAQLRHNGLPGGHAVELGFADKYIAKDGPSAAVACALLVEGAITGKEWDPAFAVTGDMNADGSVQPIGGVQAKVRGATKGGCKIVGIPSKNEKAIPDILILEGPAPLVQIGVFSISKFDEALALADPKRADALARALAELENVRNVLSRMSVPQMLGTLRTQQAQSRLQYILQAAPNCLSAKYLLLFAQGRGPRSLSIGGSIEAADSSAIGLIQSISNDVEKSVNTLKGDEVGTGINKLKNLRPKLDPQVWPYVDNVITYGEVIRSSILNPVRSGARYVDLVTKARQAAQAAKAAFEKITGDPQVREELGL